MTLNGSGDIGRGWDSIGAPLYQNMDTDETDLNGGEQGVVDLTKGLGVRKGFLERHQTALKVSAVGAGGVAGGAGAAALSGAVLSATTGVGVFVGGSLMIAGAVMAKLAKTRRVSGQDVFSSFITQEDKDTISAVRESIENLKESLKCAMQGHPWFSFTEESRCQTFDLLVNNENMQLWKSQLSACRLTAEKTAGKFRKWLGISDASDTEVSDNFIEIGLEKGMVLESDKSSPSDEIFKSILEIERDLKEFLQEIEKFEKQVVDCTDVEAVLEVFQLNLEYEIRSGALSKDERCVCVFLRGMVKEILTDPDFQVDYDNVRAGVYEKLKERLDDYEGKEIDQELAKRFMSILEKLFTTSHIEEPLKCLMIGQGLSKIEEEARGIKNSLKRFNQEGELLVSQQIKSLKRAEIPSDGRVIETAERDLQIWLDSVSSRRPPIQSDAAQKEVRINTDLNEYINVYNRSLDCPTFETWKERDRFLKEKKEVIESLITTVEKLAALKNDVFKGHKKERFDNLLEDLKLLKFFAERPLTRLDVLNILSNFSSSKPYFSLKGSKIFSEIRHFICSLIDKFLLQSSSNLDSPNKDERFKQAFEAVYQYLNKSRLDCDKPLDETLIVQIDFMVPSCGYSSEQSRHLRQQFFNPWKLARDFTFNLDQSQYADLGKRAGEDLFIYELVNRNNMSKLMKFFDDLKENVFFKECVYAFWEGEREDILEKSCAFQKARKGCLKNGLNLNAEEERRLAQNESCS